MWASIVHSKSSHQYGFISSRRDLPVFHEQRVLNCTYSLLCHLHCGLNRRDCLLLHHSNHHSLPFRLLLVKVRTFHYQLPDSRSIHYRAEPTIPLESLSFFNTARTQLQRLVSMMPNLNQVLDGLERKQSFFRQAFLSSCKQLQDLEVAWMRGQKTFSKVLLLRPIVAINRPR